MLKEIKSEEMLDNKYINILEKIIKIHLGLRKKGLKVVEMGVGKGSISLALHNIFPTFEITMVDKDLAFFQKEIQRRSLKKVFVCLEEDIKKTSIPSDSQDFVFYHKMMHHLNEKEIPLVLQEAHRVLKPDGKVVIIDNSTQVKNERQRIYLEIHECEKKIALQSGTQPEQFHAPEILEKFLRKAGFSVEKRCEPILNTMVLPVAQWFRMEENLMREVQQLKGKIKKTIMRDIERIGKRVLAKGLETLPYLLIIGRKLEIDKSIPVKENVCDI